MFPHLLLVWCLVAMGTIGLVAICVTSVFSLPIPECLRFRWTTLKEVFTVTVLEKSVE